MNASFSKNSVLALALAGFLSLVSSVSAATTATQTVTYQVQAINQLSASGNPAPLIITTATAGSAPTPVSDSSTTYAYTTNQTPQRITAALATAMPAGTTLQVLFAAPSGGSSAGTVTLSTTATDVVTGLANGRDSAKAITYTFSATEAAGVVSSSTKTVTITLTAG